MDIWIKIKSAFEGKGTEDAKKAVDDIKKSAESSAEGTSKSFRAISAAQQATTGGLQGMGNAIKEVTGLSGGFSRFLGPLALLLAAIAAVKAAYDAWKESIAAARDAIRNNEAANAVAKVKSLADAYESLSRSTNKAKTALETELSLQRESLDVNKQLALVKNDQEKANELAKTSPDDETARQKIELKYGARAKQIESDFTSKGIDQDTSAMKQKMQQNQKDIADLEETKRSSMEEIARNISNMQRYQKELSPKRGFFETPKHYSDAVAEIAERVQPAIEQSKSNIASHAASVKTMQEQIEAKKKENELLSGRVSLSPIRQQTIDTLTVAASTEAETQTRDINSAEAKRQAETIRKINLDNARAAAEEDLPRLKRAADREAAQAKADAARGRRPGDQAGSATTEYMRVDALLKRSATDDAAIASLLSKYIDAKKRSDSQIAAAIKRDAA